MKLENMFDSFGKGFVPGLSKIIDPVGTSLSYFDKWITGAGYSSERAPKTFHNRVYERAYNNPDKKLKGGEEYVPRAAGTGAGIGVGAAAFCGLYAIHPVLGLAAPIVTGIYGLFNAVKKYAHDFIDGEKIKNRNEKASFKEGFYYGWNQLTHLYMPLVHDVEGGLTGRGLNNSRVKSSIKYSSKPMRRNFNAIAGSFLGSIVGAVASIASLGIIPLYKSVRDTGRTLG